MRRFSPIAILVTIIIVMMSGRHSLAASSILDYVDGDHSSVVIQKASEQFKQDGQLLIKDFFDRVDKTSKDLLNEGKNTGKIALLQAGNEMQLATSQARLQFGAEMDRKMSEASADFQPYLAELERWHVDRKDIENAVIDLEDSIAMDLGDRLPFSPDFFGIRRVSPGAFLKGEPSYQIAVTGDNFGSAIAGQTVAVSATLAGQPLDAPQPAGPHRVMFTVPAKLIVDHFMDETISTVPFEVTVVRHKNDWLFGSWWVHLTDPVTMSISIILLPDLVGSVTVETRRPTYGWIDEEPEIQSEPIAAPTTFTFHSVAGVAAGHSPIVGNEKYSGSATSTCSAIMQNAWRLHNGTVVLDSDPMIQSGWDTPRYVGEPEPPDWNSFNATVQGMLGWNPNWGGARSCPHGTHCHLTPDDINSNSTAITVPVERCSRLRQTIVQPAPDGSSITVVITGNADQPSLWSVSAGRKRYAQIGWINDSAQTKKVYQSKPLELEIQGAPEDSISTLEFSSVNSRPATGIIATTDVGGLHYTIHKELGGETFYYYGFVYGGNLFTPN